MKSCYVLIEETNLKNQIRDKGISERNTRVFSDFESAKNGMRSLIREYATTENKLFDKDGNVKGLKDSLQDAQAEYEADYGDECEYDMLELFSATPDILRNYFLGEEIKVDDAFLNNMNKLEFELSEYRSGWLESWMNIDTDRDLCPYRLHSLYHFFFMQINSFEMDDPEKVYVCRIHSACEEWDQPDYLYLELRKVEME